MHISVKVVFEMRARLLNRSVRSNFFDRLGYLFNISTHHDYFILIKGTYYLVY
jgi:hypothetical protein